MSEDYKVYPEGVNGQSDLLFMLGKYRKARIPTGVILNYLPFQICSVANECEMGNILWQYITQTQYLHIYILNWTYTNLINWNHSVYNGSTKQ